MAVGVVTSLVLPLAEGEVALAVIFGLAGLGVAAFTPSALSLVGDAAPPDSAGRAYAWYSTAHYGAIGVGPFLGGVVAEWWGFRAALVVSAVGIAAALALGWRLPTRASERNRLAPAATFADIRRNPHVWAGWTVSVAGLLVQGVVFTFFPLLARERGWTPAAIGLVFLVLGAANTAARVPAGRLVDRTRRCAPFALGGVLVASLATALVPHAGGGPALLVLIAVFGAMSGVAFVAVSVALAASVPAAARGLVMGGYSTSLYLGLALGSFAFGPVITRYGYAVGFTMGAVAGVAGTLVAGALWLRSARPPSS
jgi:predicted MFS family arabinose efflux permease